MRCPNQAARPQALERRRPADHNRRVKRHIVMLGTALDSHSGIASLVNLYIGDGLFRRWPVRFVPTHGDRGRLGKLVIAARAWVAFVWLLATGRVALLHALAASHASFWRKALFILPARMCGVPYVMHMHCGHFASFHAACGPRAQRLIRSMLEGARVVIVLSEEWRTALSAIAPAARVAVVPNPIEAPSSPALLGAGRPTVLYLGILKQAKGVYDLLHAWPAVLRSIPDARLVLAGSGEAGRVRELAGALGIRSSVHTPGWLTGSDKDAALRAAWVFAMPSYAEALPMAILECMAAGIPVVASSVGGIPHAVEHGKSGLLIAAGDRAALSGALVRLLGDTALREAMGSAARKRALARFSPVALVPQIEAVWREIASRQELRLRG